MLYKHRAPRAPAGAQRGCPIVHWLSAGWLSLQAPHTMRSGQTKAGADMGEVNSLLSTSKEVGERRASPVHALNETGSLECGENSLHAQPLPNTEVTHLLKLGAWGSSKLKSNGFMEPLLVTWH